MYLGCPEQAHPAGSFDVYMHHPIKKLLLLGLCFHGMETCCGDSQQAWATSPEVMTEIRAYSNNL